MSEKKEFKINNKIYAKAFSISALGYDAFEVDNFLDTINFEIYKLETELDRLKDEIASLRQQIIEKDETIKTLSKKSLSNQSNPQNIDYRSNMNLVGRLNNIENRLNELVILVKDKN